MIGKLESMADLRDALVAPRVLLYKHSTRCGLSTRAAEEVATFAENFPDARVELVDVVADRAISNAIEARFGVRHESPQILLVVEGSVVDHVSHREVTADTLASWWEEALERE